MTDFITVGRIVRPQGNRGEVVVAPLTDFPDLRFRVGERLWVLREGRPEVLTITRSREHDGRWVVGLAGVATIDDAERLRGLEAHIPAAALQALDAGRHYVHDLVGCRVEVEDGRLVGVVRTVQLDAGVPLLEVEGPKGDVLIPFTEAICRRVDVTAGTIVIAPLEGLLELNAERTPGPQRTSGND